MYYSLLMINASYIYYFIVHNVHVYIYALMRTNVVYSVCVYTQSMRSMESCFELT